MSTSHALRSLPHRQLRNSSQTSPDRRRSSLPHRQLRNGYLPKMQSCRAFTAAQAAQKVDQCDHDGGQRFHCRTGSSEEHGNRISPHRPEFTAAQAAQKQRVGVRLNEELFTAAQAAQKIPAVASPDGATFTAAQAAQKYSIGLKGRDGKFTAAQAALKSISVVTLKKNVAASSLPHRAALKRSRSEARKGRYYVHCRTGSFEKLSRCKFKWQSIRVHCRTGSFENQLAADRWIPAASFTAAQAALKRALRCRSLELTLRSLPHRQL